MGIKIQDQIRHTEIRQKTKVIDIPKFILHQKWKWAGHVARREDTRWNKKYVQSGDQEQEKDQEEGQNEGGAMTSGRERVQRGQEEQ